MGGCATKPKVSKADAGEPPVQPPAEEVMLVAKEEKKVADGELVLEEKVKEIVENDDSKVDDEPGSNKRRSLSLLFKENPEERKGSVASEKISTEAVKEAEVLPEVVISTKEPESKTEEVAEILKTDEAAETKPEEKTIASLEQPPVPSAVENDEGEVKTIEEVKSVNDKPSASAEETPTVIVVEDSTVAYKEKTIEEAKPAPEPTVSGSKSDDVAKQTETESEKADKKVEAQAVKEA